MQPSAQFTPTSAPVARPRDLTADNNQAHHGRTTRDSGKIIISIHDVSPKFTLEIDLLLALLKPLVDVSRIAMLVVPDHWDEAPINQNDAFSERLLGWSDQGMEMILHGWSHRDTTDHTGIANRLRARFLTANEGEFLGLSREQARERLERGRDVLSAIIHQSVSTFIAPAWLYGLGAHQALADCGFVMAEDHFQVWNPSTDAILSTGPVISWASRSRMRIASSIFFARVAPVLLARQQLVRIALHPGDAHVPALLDSIEKTVRHFTRHREVVRYASLQ